VENVASGSSYCSDPAFKQTFPLPSAGASSSLSSSMAVVATSLAAVVEWLEDVGNQVAEGGGSVDGSTRKLSWNLTEGDDAFLSGNSSNAIEPSPSPSEEHAREAIVQLSCPYSRRGARMSAVMRVFVMVSAAAFAISAVGFVVSLLGAWAWRRIHGPSAGQLPISDESSQHNMLIGDRSNKSGSHGESSKEVELRNCA